MGIASWWSKFLEREQEPRRETASPADEPVDLDAPARKVSSKQVNDQLRIHDYRHVTHAMGGPIAVRTFMTEGLEAVNARELRVTFPADWDADAIGTVHKVLSTLHRLAADGRPAVLGGFTGLEVSGLAGGDLIGLTYARGAVIPGIPKAESALVAILLHPEELELVQQGLVTRVLGRLTARARVFPYPPCWEVRATPVFRAADQAASLLEKVPRASLGDLRVTAIEEPSPEEPSTTVFLSLPPNAPRAFRELWSDASMQALALHAFLAPDADAQATWMPGMTERTANMRGTAPPRRIGYAFLMIAGTAEPDADFRFIEDGIGLLLPEAALARLREALISGEALSLPLGGRSRLVLEPRPQAIHDPFTGGRLQAEEGWESYKPDAPRSRTGPVEIEQVILLLPESELGARIDLPAFAAFIESIEQLVARLAGLHPVEAPLEIAIRVTLAPEERPQAQLAARGATREQVAQLALIAPLLQALEELAPVPVRGEVPFQIRATIHPPPRGN